MLSGGLGNQMFQYAFYLSLRNKGINCLLDTSLYTHSEMHQGFELDRIFPISPPLVTSNLLNEAVAKAMYKFKPKHLVYKDNPFMYDINAYKASCLFYVGGWIHPAYFAPIAEEVKKAFQFLGINNKNTDFAKQVSCTDSIAIHIRRGDYLTNSIYNVCDERYHSLAINRIKEICDDPILIVFSNDSKWCCEYMKRFNTRFLVVNWNHGKDSYQDMYLMSKCRHNIIANSTFSWWAAWLNRNENKVVISPSNWTTKNEMNYSFPGWEFINSHR